MEKIWIYPYPFQLLEYQCNGVKQQQYQFNLANPNNVNSHLEITKLYLYCKTVRYCYAYFTFIVRNKGTASRKTWPARNTGIASPELHLDAIPAVSPRVTIILDAIPAARFDMFPNLYGAIP